MWSDFTMLNLSDVVQWRRQWGREGLRVAFTNGCFDLLHYGHIDYLEKTALLADRLILGLNSDRSVSRIKGNHRPIQAQDSRARVMGALACIDAVVLFEEDTPLALIRALMPDVLVKGGDYTIETIVGSVDVIKSGGSVVMLPIITGYSTSSIEKKILEAAAR